MNSGQAHVATEKKPKGKDLTRAEKRNNRNNRKLSRVRVVVEHTICAIKRCRCVKDTLRNTRQNCSDDFMAISTALHNLRISQRIYALRR